MSTIKLSDFNKWNKIKKDVSMKLISPNCKAREVWWCTIGKNIGVEQSCKDDTFSRPVLVIKVFNRDMFWGLPITSSNSNDKKSNSKFHYDVSGVPKLKGYVTISQLRTFDNKRLIRKIVKIEKEMLEEIKEKIIDIL